MSVEFQLILPLEPPPLVVNLFGAPGTGKSTMALGLTYFLKRDRLNVELASEYAKELTFAQRMLGAASLQDQIYIFAKQRARIEQLIPHSDIVVTDCPVLLGANYYAELFPDSFRDLLLWSFNSYTSLNVYITRSHEYSTVGRRQSEAESDQIAEEMRTFIDKHGVDYIEVSGDDAGLEIVLAEIRNRRPGK